MKRTWALYVQTREGHKELGLGKFDSYSDALKEARVRAQGKYKSGDVVGARRPDVPAPDEEKRQKLLAKIEDGGNGESVEDRRARAKKILTELMADDLRRKGLKPKKPD